ncbi:carboxypeptidase-like regulatory domain-containing protein [Cryptosporangium phraense]|uniref:carboxypeptidase-like regulatory domain-containing protein n=1 Tax=Cryptosporangium phraense TaxID=2593070 RepID=UPI001478A4F9|nr:carboxypeptidase-like regulatory domain-containing protein [Cryptosporangium phraense]
MTPADEGPIRSAVEELAGWLGAISGKPVQVRTPPPAPEEDDVTLWAIELRSRRRTAGTGERHPYRFVIRCLVTAELSVLDRILTAAVVDGRPISPEPLDLGVWAALGTVPRPGLLLEVPAVVAYPRPAVPLVHDPLTLRTADARAVDGTVLGAGDRPLAALRIEAVGSGRSTHTDARGRFRLAGLPADGSLRIRIGGRGRQFVAVVSPVLGEPLVIRCPIGNVPSTSAGGAHA